MQQLLLVRGIAGLSGAGPAAAAGRYRGPLQAPAHVLLQADQPPGLLVACHGAVGGHAQQPGQQGTIHQREGLAQEVWALDGLVQPPAAMWPCGFGSKLRDV
jgi:hypothetical protein